MSVLLPLPASVWSPSSPVPWPPLLPPSPMPSWSFVSPVFGRPLSAPLKPASHWRCATFPSSFLPSSVYLVATPRSTRKRARTTPQLSEEVAVPRTLVTLTTPCSALSRLTPQPHRELYASTSPLSKTNLTGKQRQTSRLAVVRISIIFPYIKTSLSHRIVFVYRFCC